MIDGPRTNFVTLMKRSVAVARFVLLVLWATPAFARWDDGESGHPALRVFSRADYGEKAMNQTMVRDRRGRLYVCNDRLLQYDGRTWSSIAINDAYELRFISLDEQDRIWVCAVGELGFLDEDAAGNRVYHSLNA